MAKIQMIRGQWHGECKIEGLWIVSTFGHKPNETEVFTACRVQYERIRRGRQ